MSSDASRHDTNFAPVVALSVAIENLMTKYFPQGVHGNLASVAVRMSCSQCSHFTLEGLNLTFQGGQRDGIDCSCLLRHSHLEVISPSKSLKWHSSTSLAGKELTESVSSRCHKPALKSFVAEQRDVVARSATRAAISTACSPHLPLTTMLSITCKSSPVALRKAQLTWLQLRSSETLPISSSDHVFFST